MKACSQHSIAAIWADSYILSIISLPIFSHRLDSSLIHFAVIRKFRSFNQQRHRADTATNSQTAAIPSLCAIEGYFVLFDNLTQLFCIFNYQNFLI